jgi:diguanylate cyclase
MAACVFIALIAFLVGAALVHAAHVRRATPADASPRRAPALEEHAELAALAAESMFKVNRSLQTELARAREAVGVEKEKTHILSAEARTDKLTGLPNRRVFDEEIERQIECWQANRQKPVTLMLIDVDHFKQINDRHGHPTGDAALKWLARIAGEQVADGGLVTRFGGEEFAVILPACETREASGIAERLRVAIATTPFEHHGVTLCITASIGMATSQADDGSKSLTRRADEALYSAKKNGRNRVFLHQGATCVPTSIAAQACPAARTLECDDLSPLCLVA